MKVGPVNNSAQIVRNQGKTPNKERINKNGNLSQTDRYVPGTNTEKLTYGRSAGSIDQESIQKLKAQSEKAFESLKRLVEQLLQRQGYSGSIQGRFDIMQVDEPTRIEAEALIAEDGPLGPEAVSERIVDFAIAISAGDKSKVAILKGAIDEGFRQVKNMLGSLPDVSLRTYDLIMEKLDRWSNSE